MAVRSLLPLQTGGGTTGTLGIILIAGLAIWLFLEWRGIDPEAAVAGLAGSSSSGLIGVATSVNGILIGGITLLSALVIGGVLDLPEGWGIQFVVILELVAFALLLRELDAFDPILYALVATGTIMIGLSAAGQPIVGAVANSPMGIILALGVVYVLYKWITADEGQVVEVVGRVRRGDNE